jgi:mannose-6-phosphate isomerase-like protein (cupin superfamily)
MKIVQGDELKADARSSHRGGVVSYVRLLDGEPGSPDNFSLVVARTPGRFSPRHRHNFEQFRMQLEGVADYGRTGKLKPGMIGYFPEGVHYGPQTQGEDLAMLVLQCGGASGGGYLGREAEVSVAEELKKYGEFKDGVFHRNEGLPGKRNLDAFQALWEHAMGKPMVYPKGRYDRPIFMNPENFDWVRVEGHEGVWQKFVGAFSECCTGASFIRLDAGAEYETRGNRDILFILSGRGTVDRQPLREMTTIWLEPGDHLNIVASAPTEIVNLRLPDLSVLQARHEAAHAVAAE